MILWLLLFALVIAISFVLAIKSMVDYHEIPSQTGQEYGLFLIRNRQALTKELLSLIYEDLAKSGLVLSLERLFRGSESALVIYGPKIILSPHTASLDFLELEDYTSVNVEQTSAWEVGVRNLNTWEGNAFKNFPILSPAEQFWWQMILMASPKHKGEKSFQVQIRTVTVFSNESKKKSLAQSLQNFAPDKLIKLPKAFSNSQLLDFYQKRSFKKSETNPVLNPLEILQFVML